VLKRKGNVKQYGLDDVAAVAKPLLPLGTTGARTIKLLYERIAMRLKTCL